MLVYLVERIEEVLLSSVYTSTVYERYKGRRVLQSYEYKCIEN